MKKMVVSRREKTLPCRLLSSTCIYHFYLSDEVFIVSVQVLVLQFKDCGKEFAHSYRLRTPATITGKGRSIEAHGL